MGETSPEIRGALDKKAVCSFAHDNVAAPPPADIPAGLRVSFVIEAVVFQPAW